MIGGANRERLQRRVAEPSADRGRGRAVGGGREDDLPDVRSQLTEKEKQIEEIKAAKEAAEVERDQFRDKYVSMYFTSPEQAKRDQSADIQRDARPEGIRTLFKFRQGY